MERVEGRGRKKKRGEMVGGGGGLGGKQLTRCKLQRDDPGKVPGQTAVPLRAAAAFDRGSGLPRLGGEEGDYAVEGFCQVCEFPSLPFPPPPTPKITIFVQASSSIPLVPSSAVHITDVLPFFSSDLQPPPAIGRQVQHQGQRRPSLLPGQELHVRAEAGPVHCL